MPAYGKVKVDTITYDLSGTATDVSVSNIATKASPTFTGTVTVPTPSAGDDSTKAASTAFVVASFATKASPTFTGTVTVPTASADDNTTKAASTAYVQTELGDYALKASPAFTGTATGVNLTLSGDLTVNGTTTTINTTTLQVEDKNIEIGKVSTPSDATADGGGLTLLGATNKTWNWVNATDAWTSSEHIHITEGKKLILGSATSSSNDFQLIHDGTNTFIQNKTGYLKIANNVGGDVGGDIFIQAMNGEDSIKCIHDGAVELFFNNVKTAETVADGLKLFGSEGNPAYLAMSADEEDDTSDRWLLSATDGSGFTLSGLNAGSSWETSIKAVTDGAVELYHNNVKKIETTSGGINVTGAISVNGAALSAAPEVALTASEAITAEDAIMVKTNGQAEKVTGVISGLGAIASTFGTGPSTYRMEDSGSIIYDENSDKYVCMFYDGGNSDRLTAMAGTGSGTSIIWGNKTEISTDSTDTDPPKQRIALVYVPGRNKVAFFLRNNSNNGYTKGGYITVSGSGTSVTATLTTNSMKTFGTPNIAGPSAAYGGGGLGLVIAVTQINSSKKPKVERIDISSDTSMTDAQGLDLTNQNQSHYSLPDIVYSTYQNYVIVFNGNTQRPKVRCLRYYTWQLMGNTNGDELTTETISSDCGPKVAWNSVDNKFLCIYPHSSNGNIKGIIFTASDAGVVSAGTSFTIVTGTFDEPNAYYVSYNANSNRFIVSYTAINSNLSAVKVLTYNSSTNQCDIADTLTIQNSHQSHFINTCNNPDDNRFGIVYNNEGASDAGRTTTYTPDDSNIDPARFVGFAKASVSSGAEVTVKVNSNTSTRSGLTPASTYYVLGDGSIGTSPAPNGTIKAGLALTATKLLINRDNES